MNRGLQNKPKCSEFRRINDLRAGLEACRPEMLLFRAYYVV